MLLTPACLILLLLFLPFYTLNPVFHFVHRTFFSGLIFYVPPSDAALRNLLPKSLLDKSINTKLRKKLAKRYTLNGGAGSASSVDLQLGSIPHGLYSTNATSSRFHEFQSFITVNAAVIVLILIEQMWVCYSITNEDTTLADGRIFAASEATDSVRSSTVLLLTLGLLYNIYIGWSLLMGSANATVANVDQATSGATAGTRSSASDSYWNRMVFGLGFFMFFLSMFLQNLSPANPVTNNFLTSDAKYYHHYLNQVMYNLIRSWNENIRAALEKSAMENPGEAPPTFFLEQFIPKTLPSDSAQLVMERYVPLWCVKMFLSFICAIISTSFFCCAWRYAKLLAEKIEENAEMLAAAPTRSSSGKKNASDATSSSSSSPTADEQDSEEAALSTSGKLKVILATGFHYFNLLSPLFIVMLWIPSLSSTIWLRLAVPVTTAESTRNYAGEFERAWRQFDLFRSYAVCVCLVLRIVASRAFVQSFLLSALTVIRLIPTNGQNAIDQNIAFKIQFILKSIFWYTPLMALQFVYPIVISSVLMLAWKLAEDFAPSGNQFFTPRTGGWGMCYGLLGKGVSPLRLSSSVVASVVANATSTITQAASTSASVAAAAAASIQQRPIDDDEFDGDLSALEMDDHPIAASAAASVPVVQTSTAYYQAFSQFVPPNRANVLATAVGFLVWWSHFVWFVETALCFGYLRFARRTRPLAARTLTTQEAERDAEMSTTAKSVLKGNSKKES